MICITRLFHVGDMTCMMGLVHMCNSFFLWLHWLIHICDIADSCVWHGSFTGVTWLWASDTFLPTVLTMCGTTYSYVRHDSFMCDTRLIHIRDVAHSCEWHAYVTHTDECDMTLSHLWNDSFMCSKHPGPIKSIPPSLLMRRSKFCTCEQVMLHHDILRYSMSEPLTHLPVNESLHKWTWISHADSIFHNICQVSWFWSLAGRPWRLGPWCTHTCAMVEAWSNSGHWHGTK